MSFDPVSFAAGKRAGGGGTEPVLVPLSVDANGEYYPVNYGADGFDSVYVNFPETVLTALTVTENGDYDPADDHADGYDRITVQVPPPTILSMSFIQNGDYDPADDHADGFGVVHVAVPQGLFSHSYSAASLSAVNVAQIITDKADAPDSSGSIVYGWMAAAMSMGGTTMPIQFPIQASFSSDLSSLSITGGASTGGMGAVTALSGTVSGGLTASVLDLIQSGTVTDLATVAEQIISSVMIRLWW